MLEIPEHLRTPGRRFSRTPPFDIDDKTHPARIMLKLRVVESLLLGNQRLFHALSRGPFDVRQALAWSNLPRQTEVCRTLIDNGLKQIWPPTQLVDGPQGNVIEPSTTMLRLYYGVDHNTVIRWREQEVPGPNTLRLTLDFPLGTLMTPVCSYFRLNPKVNRLH
jgi:hypothetical protein